ncbi:MAG: hypothetical protein AB1486_08480 [Planctomycetota bacterium]
MSVRLGQRRDPTARERLAAGDPVYREILWEWRALRGAPSL